MANRKGGQSLWTHPVIANLYRWGCILVGAGLLCYYSLNLPLEYWDAIIFFTILVSLCEAMPVWLPRGGGTVSVSFIVIYATIILFGPAGGCFAATMGSMSLTELRSFPLRAVLFNRGQLAICGAAAGIAFSALSSPGLPPSFPGDLPALILAGFTYGVVNITLTLLYLSFHWGARPLNVWVTNFRWLVPVYFILMPMGVLLALVYIHLGVGGVILLLFPLVGARYAFQRYVDMREVYRSTISALSHALDAKDPHTYGHSERVAYYATAIGRRLGLAEDQIEMLEYIGLLHDIGKIGIGDVILNKPGVFTPSEYEEMKKHATIGADIISGIHILGKSASWVRHHHERYDGTGFPDGISGERIPFGARIISVADAFDAITSERPYKRAMTLEECREELIAHSGTQFDPKIVGVMIELMNESKVPIPKVEVGSRGEAGSAVAGKDAGEQTRIVATGKGIGGAMGNLVRGSVRAFRERRKAKGA